MSNTQKEQEAQAIQSLPLFKQNSDEKLLPPPSQNREEKTIALLQDDIFSHTSHFISLSALLTILPLVSKEFQNHSIAYLLHYFRITNFQTFLVKMKDLDPEVRNLVFARTKGYDLDNAKRINDFLKLPPREIYELACAIELQAEEKNHSAGNLSLLQNNNRYPYRPFNTKQGIMGFFEGFYSIAQALQMPRDHYELLTSGNSLKALRHGWITVEQAHTMLIKDHGERRNYKRYKGYKFLTSDNSLEALSRGYFTLAQALKMSHNRRQLLTSDNSLKALFNNWLTVEQAHTMLKVDPIARTIFDRI